MAFGAGVGFSVVSPWSDQGISATSFTISAGIYLIVIAMLSSTIGGYLAGRLRSQWQTVHESERYFRDSAHGFVTWALATVVTAAVLGGATTAIIGATGAGLAAGTPAAVRSAPRQTATSMALLRPARDGQHRCARRSKPDAGQPAGVRSGHFPVPPGRPRRTCRAVRSPHRLSRRPASTVAKISRILATGLARTGSVSDADKSYLASVDCRPHRPVAAGSRSARQPDHHAGEDGR